MHFEKYAFKNFTGLQFTSSSCETFFATLEALVLTLVSCSGGFDATLCSFEVCELVFALYLVFVTVHVAR